MWLPAGGHVDVDEAPERAAARELHEELGVDAPFLGATGPAPLLITVTRTVPGTRHDLAGKSPDVPHVDVSLWYVFTVERARAGSMTGADHDEFVDGRWWAFDEIVHGPDTRFDPHLPRFKTKLAALV